MATQLPLIESRPEETLDRLVPARRAHATGASRAADPTGPTRRAGARRSREARAFAATDRSGRLIEIPAADWRIDQHTKEVGMAGVAAARQALAAAVGRAPHPEGDRAAA